MGGYVIDGTKLSMLTSLFSSKGIGSRLYSQRRKRKPNKLLDFLMNDAYSAVNI